jgi:hypothetical protein
VDESFLEALLDDVLRVFSDAAEASRNTQKSLLMPGDQNSEGPSISTLGGMDKSRFLILVRDVRSQRV